MGNVKGCSYQKSEKYMAWRIHKNSIPARFLSAAETMAAASPITESTCMMT